MKLHIKEKLRNIVYSETTKFKPLSQLIKTKGAPKKAKPTLSENSTMRSPFYFEHVETLFLDFPTSKFQKNIVKGVRIGKPSLTPYLPKFE